MMATAPATDAPLVSTAIATTSTTSISNARPTFSIQNRLYDFANSALIRIFSYPYVTVCDMYCGFGADLNKWEDAQIGHYIGIDESTSGICEFKETWESDLKPYTAHFCEMDPCTENLESLLQEKGLPADIVCCFQHLQRCFESEEKARKLLQNVSAMLRPGGYFFGVTPDSSTIWTKYQKIVEASHNKGLKPNNVQNCIRSESYVITFEVEEEKFPLFGKKYQLKFSDNSASETNCLVHFSSLIRLAREAGLDFVEIQNLTEFYDDNRAQFAGMFHNYGPNFIDPRGKLLVRPDALGLYSIFVFQKPDPDVVPPLFIVSPPDEGYMNEEQEQNEERNNTDIAVTEPQPNTEKGILGPAPADLVFLQPFKGVQYPDDFLW